VQYLPEFYTCFLNMLDDARFPARPRLYVNVSFAYLISPEDMIPEEEVELAGHIIEVSVSLFAIRNIVAGASGQDFHGEKKIPSEVSQR